MQPATEHNLLAVSTFLSPAERAATLEPEGWSEPGAYLCLVMPLRLLD